MEVRDPDLSLETETSRFMDQSRNYTFVDKKMIGIWLGPQERI
jgi:hypothetical protein